LAEVSKNLDADADLKIILFKPSHGKNGFAEKI